MVRVSAGIVRRPDGRILICRRGPGRKNAGLWEFPGGKQENGETPESCLERELIEELKLGIESPGLVFSSVQDGLAFDFVAARTEEEPALSEHDAYEWALPRELLGHDFCPADAPVARALALNAPKLIYFFWDYDGTLIDTYPAMVRAMNGSCKCLGFSVDEAELLGLLKESVPYAASKLAERHGIDSDELLRDFSERNHALPMGDLALIPGIEETLREIHKAGGKNFLVTHRDASAWAGLRAHGLDGLFYDGVTAEDGLARKPAPDMLLYLLKKYELDPGACVMIGDRPLDIECGHAAGMIGCLIDPEQRFMETRAELRVRSAEGLSELLCPPPIAGL